MAWEDVPARLAYYDTLDYADDSGGETPSVKLVRNYGGLKNGVVSLDNVPVELRDDLEADLEYRIGACENLAKARAWKPGPNWP